MCPAAAANKKPLAFGFEFDERVGGGGGGVGGIRQKKFHIPSVRMCSAHLAYNFYLNTSADVLHPLPGAKEKAFENGGQRGADAWRGVKSGRRLVKWVKNRKRHFHKQTISRIDTPVPTTPQNTQALLRSKAYSRQDVQTYPEFCVGKAFLEGFAWITYWDF